ncbi:MAG TPA: hypothetical protein VGZ73_03855, partial [Bryobacteraceae bacterium]|nr:hypothetical protein [Bryobacteraceae bacterium]
VPASSSARTSRTPFAPPEFAVAFAFSPRLTPYTLSLWIGEFFRGSLSVLVNYCLTLHRPDMKDLATLFWQQMEWIRPESYVADNDYLNFVSMNKALFASVRDAVKALG